MTTMTTMTMTTMTTMMTIDATKHILKTHAFQIKQLEMWVQGVGLVILVLILFSAHLALRGWNCQIKASRRARQNWLSLTRLLILTERKYQWRCALTSAAQTAPERFSRCFDNHLSRLLAHLHRVRGPYSGPGAPAVDLLNLHVSLNERGDLEPSIGARDGIRRLPRARDIQLSP